MSNNTKSGGKIWAFLASQTVSLFGSSLVQYSIIWYITLQTSSGLMMTLATICGFLPQVCISLFAGAWADRQNRKKMVILADISIACATGIIALCFILGYREIWLLFAVLAVRSAGTGIQTPAVNAIIPQLSPKEELLRVNGINGTLQGAVTFLSPAVGGLILTLYSLEVAFFIDIVTAIIGIAILLTIKIPQLALTTAKTTVFKDIKGGIDYVRSNILVKNQIIFLIVTLVFISPAAFLTPLLVSRSFGSQVALLTISQMSFSLGVVCGGLLISFVKSFKNKGYTLLAATLLYGSMMVGMGLSSTYIVYLVFNFLTGVSMPCFNAPSNSMLQEGVPQAYHGRVFSLVQVVQACALPLGTMLFGPLADIVPVGTVMWCTGLVVVLWAGYTKVTGKFKINKI